MEETGKKIGKGIDFMEDDKVYQLIFHADGLIQAIRAKRAFKKNKSFHILSRKEDGTYETRM